YLLALHVFAAFLFNKTYTFQKVLIDLGLEQRPYVNSPTYKATLAHQLRRDGNTSPESIAFFGDSMIQGLNTSAIIDRSENYGIGFDTTEGLLNRLSQYRSSQIANTIIICIGTNDLSILTPEQIVSNILKIIDITPETQNIYISGILPISLERNQKLQHQAPIKQTNQLLNKALRHSLNTTFIPPPNELLDKSGHLSSKHHIGDGLHLSSSGYDIWINHLKDYLNIQPLKESL
ncbi:hypothetical protein A3741_19220, partial [Oleiphilus sp. HI0069]